MAVCGVLNLDKPEGMTSRQAVDVVQRLARPAKAGHAGTLDPLASGVLVVCVGAATRLIPFVQQMRKRYRATFLLGRHSPTDDLEGPVVELANQPVPAMEDIANAARDLVGEILQRPPAFSAVWVEGRRAYKLARQGRQVTLPPRKVTVYRLEVVSYGYPEVVLDIECGGGTYVRSLGRDLAERLGTQAVMAALKRTQVGGFSLAEAVSPSQLTPANWRDFLLPPLRAVAELPQVVLSAAEVTKVQNGLSIPRPTHLTAAPQFAALDSTGRFVGVLVQRGGELVCAWRETVRQVDARKHFAD